MTNHETYVKIKQLREQGLTIAEIAGETGFRVVLADAAKEVPSPLPPRTQRPSIQRTSRQPEGPRPHLGAAPRPQTIHIARRPRPRRRDRARCGSWGVIPRDTTAASGQEP